MNTTENLYVVNIMALDIFILIKTPTLYKSTPDSFMIVLFWYFSTYE